ncbi:2-succinyl-6-hydroxy-2,4-cyclohexadiene-1-carboxylate synthase [Enterococcus faecalis]|uniref:2-succinyl-6-hydroxy-2, 4-cyclohexadiene-1-carboxylate synthase n=1 Tax=Enterococcus faecalis TaxID=1351 RepID=UPI00045A010F|nr:2-succinyl-6-hydroxy-2,4-cyclohexadiene-1-carboxylate synthase [Enterococcus faecalis]KAJ86762.1 2-succinyl-6-hydroxy-2,4-cyclohexadiene-1- carboxylate synthase [Enterococcus faecalis NY9]
MERLIRGMQYHYQWLTPFDAKRTTVVCLHGFTGTLATFAAVFPSQTPYNVLGIDSPGHGATASLVAPERYTMKQVCHDIAELTESLNLPCFCLLGYSMGARTALGFALHYPQKVQHLLLESGSPGLATAAERQARICQDHRLAERLLEEPLVDFIDFWQELPLFQTQKALSVAQQMAIRQERLSQSAFGLASSLWYMGTGAQESYWERLAELQPIPTDLLVGGEDQKFIGIAKKMQARQPLLRLTIFPEAGHCIHLEQPTIFYEKVTALLEGAV